MGAIKISEATWHTEKAIDVKSLDMTGHLPVGSEPGAAFLRMVEKHAETDLRETGNLKRFDANHCPFYVKLVTPIVLPHHPTTPVLPAGPYVPPGLPAAPSAPGTPGTPPGSPGGPPGGPCGPGGSPVPEPSSFAMLGLGLVALFICRRFR